MGCIKLHILDEQYQSTELRVSYFNKELTSNFCAEKPRNVSVYAYCANNPVRFVDPTGKSLDEYVFDQNGVYKETIKKEGENYGSIEGTNTTFAFADPVNDPKAIDEAKSGQVIFVSDTYVLQTLENSGVYNEKNQGFISGSEYLLKESNASSVDGNGNMDYTGNGRNNIDISPTTFYITNTRSGKFAHNGYNFGNFLWGAGANALGIPASMARAGAHVNNYLWDPAHKGTWDSIDDQLSISLGYEWRYLTPLEKTMQRDLEQRRKQYIEATR